jgi:hypothetical protein
VDDALASVSDADDHVRDFRAWALGTALLRGRTGTSTSLTFVDGAGAATDRQITRTPEPGHPVRFGNLPTLFARLDARSVERHGRTIGVISFNVWMTAISRPLDEAIDRFRSSKGLVLDLRGNPGGYLNAAVDISDEFLSNGLQIVYTQGKANPKKVYVGQAKQEYRKSSPVYDKTSNYRTSSPTYTSKATTTYRTSSPTHTAPKTTVSKSPVTTYRTSSPSYSKPSSSTTSSYRTSSPSYKSSTSSSSSSYRSSSPSSSYRSSSPSYRSSSPSHSSGHH